MPKLNALVAGSTGYIGVQLIKLLIKHKFINIRFLCGNSSVGKNISSYDKSLSGKKLPKIIKFNKKLLKDVDVVFTALPNGEAQDISKSYRGRKVVNSISVEVNQGEIVGLLGPNGAGKTTSFYMIVGIIKPEEGNIYLDQEVISDFPMYQRAQKGIGYLAQEESVFRKLSVEDNILGILEFSTLTKNQQKEKAEQLMEEFGLIKIRRNRGDLLSGGERRRTEIARALANDPKFLLLDEPFAGVDPIAVEDIQSIISVLKKKNIGILITDHNVQETLAITDRTYLMFEGKILKEGIPEELARDEMVRKVYLGKNFEFKKKNI